jgi:hypothetical protein
LLRQLKDDLKTKLWHIKSNFRYNFIIIKCNIY